MCVLGSEDQVAVRVRVDEARRKAAARRVDDLGRFLRAGVEDDLAVLDADAAHAGGLACSVDDPDVYKRQNLDFNFTLLQKKELNVFGSRNALKKDFVELIDLVREGRADLSKVITNTYKFDDAATAFRDFSENGANMLKVVLDFTDN